MLTRLNLFLAALALLALPLSSQTAVGYVQTETALVAVGPVADLPTHVPEGATAHVVTTDPGQKITTTWVSGGITREIETKVPTSTNGIELAISRHEKLERAMLRLYPRDP